MGKKITRIRYDQNPNRKRILELLPMRQTDLNKIFGDNCHILVRELIKDKLVMRTRIGKTHIVMLDPTYAADMEEKKEEPIMRNGDEEIVDDAKSNDIITESKCDIIKRIIKERTEKDRESLFHNKTLVKKLFNIDKSHECDNMID